MPCHYYYPISHMYFCISYEVNSRLRIDRLTAPASHDSLYSQRVSTLQTVLLIDGHRLNEITYPAQTRMFLPDLRMFYTDSSELTSMPWPVLTTLNNSTETSVNFRDNKNSCSDCQLLLPLIAWVRGTVQSRLSIDCRASDGTQINDHGSAYEWREKPDCLGKDSIFTILFSQK